MKRKKIKGIAAPQPKAKNSPPAPDLTLQIAAVLDGRFAPPNEFVAYLTKQVIAVNNQRNACQNELRQLGNRVNQLREQVTTLDGQINARISDMKEWWTKKLGPQEAPEKPVSKPESEAKDDRPRSAQA